MKKFLFALFLLPILANAQSSDTTFYQYVQFADDAYEADNLSIKAYQLYVSAVVLAAEEDWPAEYYKTLGRVYETTGAMSRDYTLYYYENVFYSRALTIYRELNDMDGIVRVIPKIALSYQDLRENDINIEPVEAEEYETAEVYYRIVEDPIYHEDGSVYVRINGGITDGLYETSVGRVYATDKESFESRANAILGNAIVEMLDTNASYLKVSGYKLNDPFYQIYAGDMVMMLSLIPKREYKSTLWELALNQVIFINQLGDPMYDYRQLLKEDSPELQNEILEIMQRDIFTTWEWLKELNEEERKEFRTIFEDKLVAGRYKGYTVYEAMEKTTKEDILAYLGFVKTFPGKYMGIPYKINETYATWVLNNCKIGYDEFLAIVSATTSDDSLKVVVETYKEELKDDDFLTYLSMSAEAHAAKSELEEALFLNAKCLKIAKFLESDDQIGWAYFNRGRIYDYTEQTDSTSFYYEKGIGYFEIAGDLKGKSYCLNNLGSLYDEAEQYKKANEFYRKAYKAKTDLIKQTNSSPSDHGYSLAKTCLGIGNTEYAVASYDSAVLAYTRGIWWADQVGDLEAKTFAISLQTEMAKVFKKRGFYGLASEIYADQVKRYFELGKKDKVADAYDNEADVLFSKGEYQQAFDKYYEAHDIKVLIQYWSGAGFSMSNCGQAMWNLGDLDSALALHNRALKYREQAGDRLGMAYSLSKIADLYKELGEPEKASKNYEEALNIYLDYGDSLKVADLAVDIGDYFTELKNYTRALEFYNYSFEMYNARGMKSEVATVLADKGFVFSQLKDYNKTKTLYSEALQIRKEINERQSIMYSLVDLSLIYMIGEYNYDTSLVMLNEALILAKETESNDYEAYCYQSIGNAYYLQAKADLADKNFRAALALYEKTGDIANRCQMLLNLGANELEKGDFKSAMTYYQKSLEVARGSGLSAAIANTYNYMAEYYYYTGDFAASFNVIDSSYRLFTQTENAYGIAGTHIVEGNTHNLIGNASVAIEQYRLADSIYISLKDPLSRATALNNMGTIRYFQGDYNGALEIFNEAKTIYDTTGVRSSLLVTVLGNIGEVYMEKGIWEESEKWLKEGTVLAQEMGNTRQEWGIKTSYAKLLYKKGKYQESADLMMGCYNAFTKSDEKMGIADCATNLGKAYLKLSELDKADQYLNEALSVYRTIGSKRLIWQPLYELSLVATEQQKPMASINYLTEAVDTLEQLSNDIKGASSQKKLFAKANDKQNIYQNLITQLVEVGDVKAAWVYQEKLNVYGLQEQTRGEPTRGADEANEEQMHLSDLELKVDGIYSQLMKEKAKPADQRSDDKINELEKLMSVASENYQTFFWDLVDNGVISNDFSNTVNPESLDQERLNLDEDIVILEYLVSEKQLIIFIASADTLGAKVIDISKENVENVVNSYYNLLVQQGDAATISKTSQELYSLLIAPVASFIKGKTKVGLVPTGVLYKLPFQSLASQQNGKTRYLVEDYSIFYLNDIRSTSTQDVLEVNGATLLAFGNADNSLKFAEKEVGMISTTFPGAVVYIKSDAHEDLAKTSMNDYKIVHFATHGNLDPINFNNSYLTMAPNLEAGEDGKLTMSEIRRIRTLGGCQLIVLSACNTAVNDQKLEGWVNNPAKAFLGKGAKSAVASLWSVDDAATGLLMQHFYQNLKAGENKVDALKHAQQKLVESEKFAHPYYWAAFELIGQWE